jgi:hypothetical protein
MACITLLEEFIFIMLDAILTLPSGCVCDFNQIELVDEVRLSEKITRRGL